MSSARYPILLAAGVIAIAIVGFLFSAPVARAVAAQDEKGDGEKKPKEEKPQPRPSGYTLEQEQKILDHFHATKMEFLESGRISLHYDYRDMDDVRLIDFLPKMETTERRMRWAQRNDVGLMVAEYGNMVHVAEWIADVKMSVVGTCYSQLAEKDLFVTGLTDPKGRDMIGSNLGEQCVSLRAMAFKDAIPVQMPSARVEQKLNFGFELDLGILYCVKDGRRINIDTKSKPKFTRKFEGGRLALRWNGRVQVCLHEITIEGKLDPKWVAKEIF